MKIVVIGGTGLIGTRLVAKLRDHGHDASAASSTSGVNTFTGAGVSEALKGSDVVVDVSNSRNPSAAAVLNFFETSTRNLLSAEAAEGVRHHVALSIAGVDRLTEGAYFRAKIAQENLVKDGPIPYSIVRSTQFFEFVNGIAAAATAGNSIRLSSALIQPIAANDAASAVSRIAVGMPINGIVEIAGPQAFGLDELVRQELTAKGDPREVITDPEARYFGAMLRQRTLLPEHGATLGTTRFEDWLQGPVPS